KALSEKADDRFYRRERTERAAPSGANLGTARPDAGAAISLQLEDALGRGRHHLVEHLLRALPEDHADARGGELPRPLHRVNDLCPRVASLSRIMCFWVRNPKPLICPRRAASDAASSHERRGIKDSLFSP